MPDIKVRVTNELYAKVKASRFSEYQIIRLGVEYGEMLTGIVKDRGKPVTCRNCRGTGTRVSQPEWKMRECSECGGTGITYSKES